MPVTRAHAKINIGLHVLRRRDDGFHDIETVMVRIGWSDRVRVEAAPGGSISFSCSDPDLPADEDNTCVRAARLLAERFKVTDGADIHLEKRVPHGAGLGGGSSDAAAVLLLLRDQWRIECTDTELEGLGARIGSDVPFFIRGVPALATGRGTRLSPLMCSPDEPYRLPFFVVVVVPGFRVSTADAYASIEPAHSNRPDLGNVVCSNDAGRWRNELANDFEHPLRVARPSLEEIFDYFVRSGACYASLSGSGSAVYGLYETEKSARLAYAHTPPAAVHAWFGRAA